MIKVIVNKTDGSGSISIEDSLLLKAYTIDSVTRVEYLLEEDGYRRTASVNEGLSAVGNTSQLLVSTTLLDGSTVWINKDRVNDSYEVNSKAFLMFDGAGAGLERIELDVTEVTWANAVITKSGDLSYLLDSFTAAPNTILLDASEGDVESNFGAGDVFTVFGEGDSNDGIYTVVSAAFNGTETVVTVSETPTVNASASGYARVDFVPSTSSTSYNPGTAEAGVTATHYSADGKHFITTLSVSSLSCPAITAAAAEAHGIKLYTFPAGVHSHKTTNLDISLQGGGVVDADTPEVGIGSVIGSGANATLGAVGATSEDYVLGQVAADVNGTATVALLAATAGYGTGISLNEVGDVKAVFLNYADTWAGADTIDATGSVTLEWSIID